MLKRIYVDNYKCLVNFELKLDAINLFLGANGSGKSTVFEVLQKLRAIVNGDSRVSEEFKIESRTRWQTSPLQSFEVEITKDNRTYRYELAVEYSKNEQVARVKHERLWLDNQSLLKFEGQEARVYKEDFSEGSNFPFDGSRSVIEFLPLFNQWITQFKVRMNEILVVQISPRLIGDATDKAEPYPSAWMDNYSSWYEFLSRDQSWVFELTNTLREVLPGFENFRFVPAGENVQILKAVFSGKEQVFRFQELSDGQRALIILYTLLIASQKENYVLCSDIQFSCGWRTHDGRTAHEQKINLASQVAKMEASRTRQFQDRDAVPAPLDNRLFSLHSLSNGGLIHLQFQHLSLQTAAGMGWPAKLRRLIEGWPVLAIPFQYSLHGCHWRTADAAGILLLRRAPEPEGARPVHLPRDLFPAFHRSYRCQHHSLAVDPESADGHPEYAAWVRWDSRPELDEQPGLVQTGADPARNVGHGRHHRHLSLRSAGRAGQPAGGCRAGRGELVAATLEHHRPDGLTHHALQSDHWRDLDVPIFCPGLRFPRQP